MYDKRGKIVNKDSFLANKDFAKEQYEGLLVVADQEHGYYNIGIQLNDNEILIVDRVNESGIRERIQNWAAKIQDIQNKYGVENKQNTPLIRD